MKKGDFVRIRGNFRPIDKTYMIFDINKNIDTGNFGYHLLNIKDLHDFYFADANQIIEHTPKPANVSWLMIKRAENVLKRRFE